MVIKQKVSLRHLMSVYIFTPGITVQRV